MAQAGWDLASSDGLTQHDRQHGFASPGSERRPQRMRAGSSWNWAMCCVLAQSLHYGAAGSAFGRAGAITLPQPAQIPSLARSVRAQQW
jgi:hypothetical protein